MSPILSCLGDTMKCCNKCKKKKDLCSFEVMKTGYVRPQCKECYNKRRRDIQGGAKRDAELRRVKLDKIISSIPSCSLVSEYKPDNDHHRIKLRYKGFDWDIRRSSFVGGTRPWRSFTHSKYKGSKCVYKFEDSSGVVLYVGKSEKLAQRMSKHFSNYEIEVLNQPWKNRVAKVFVMELKNHADMHIAEMFLINKLRPTCNKDAVSLGETSFDLKLPPFTEFWVRAVYDKNN